MSRKRRNRDPVPGSERRRFEIQFTRAAQRAMARIPRSALERVDVLVRQLADNQHPAGSKKLQGAGDLYRIRAGDYRVIYSVESDCLIVLIIQNWPSTRCLPLTPIA